MDKALPIGLLAYRVVLWVVLGFGLTLPNKFAIAQSYISIVTTDGVDTFFNILGVSGAAEYCQDYCNPPLCEEELPPIPPGGILDVRFIESRPLSSCLGVGMRVNIQDGDPGSPDTFWLAIQRPNSAVNPITLTWEQYDEDPDVRLISAVISDTAPGAIPILDMVLDSVLILPDGINILQIITHTTIVGGVEQKSSDLKSFELFQNYPNPFNPTTTISYFLSTSIIVRLSVFNHFGQVVSTFEQGRRSAGFHSVSFDASGLSAGVYFARLTTGQKSTSIKLLYLK